MHEPDTKTPATRAGVGPTDQQQAGSSQDSARQPSSPGDGTLIVGNGGSSEEEHRVRYALMHGANPLRSEVVGSTPTRRCSTRGKGSS